MSEPITHIDLIPLVHRLPPGAAYGSSRGLVSACQATIVRIRTRSGVEGIGEAWGPPGAVQGYGDLYAPHFIGRDLYDYELHLSTLQASHYHFGSQGMPFLSGLEVAVLDAIGKLHNLPVCKLLGGCASASVAVYASGGYFSAEPEQTFGEQLERLARVNAPAKIKIGRSPADDELRVKQARTVLEERLLLVDVNGNYSVDSALESMRRTAPYGVHWYEEPLPPQDFDGYVELKRRAPVAIATGEALYSAFDFKRLLDGRGVDVVQPDISLCGGLRAARDIALLARLANARISPHVWGSAVGLAAACHFVASLPSFPHGANIPYPSWVEYDVGDNPLRDELLAQPIPLTDEGLRVPTGPGLGIALDAAAVRRFHP